MKNKAKELDVDFIGGQTPLTKEEEAMISEFIKASKEKNSRKTGSKKKVNSTKLPA